MTCVIYTLRSTLCLALCSGGLTFRANLLGFFTGWLQVGFGHWEAPRGSKSLEVRGRERGKKKEKEREGDRDRDR